MWDMPRLISLLLLMYLLVIVFGVLRASLDRSYMEGYPLKNLISEELINTIKWALPGILIFDGCRSRKQVIIFIVCLLAMYCLIAIQVIRRLPFEAAFVDSDVINYSRSKLSGRIGYHTSDLSTMLAGVSWGILAFLPLIQKKRFWIILLSAGCIVVFGQALTGGRVGYVAWGTTGLTLCFLKWRKSLLFAPVFVMILPIVFPGATERMLSGFGQIDVAGQNVIDSYSVTSGRMLIWPYVIDKISESPIVGYGRLAMQRTGLADYLMSSLGESFPTPHNMYLETLLDNGILGSIPILLFWGILLVFASRLFRSDNKLCSAVGGLGLSMILAQLYAGVGSQHFYPRESTVGVWIIMFLVLRVYIEEKRGQMSMAMSNVTLSEHVNEPCFVATST